MPVIASNSLVDSVLAIVVTSLNLLPAGLTLFAAASRIATLAFDRRTAHIYDQQLWDIESPFSETREQPACLATGRIGVPPLWASSQARIKDFGQQGRQSQRMAQDRNCVQRELDCGVIDSNLSLDRTGIGLAFSHAASVPGGNVPVRNRGRDVQPGAGTKEDGVSSTSGIGTIWRRIGLLTLLLTVISVIPFVVLGHWRAALGIVLGAGLLVGDIYLLKVPLDMMLGRITRGKRPWVLALTLGRIVVLAAVLYLLVRFRIASVPGLFIGVTLPIAAIAVLFVAGKLNPWKA
jgi:hypothetical protein